MEIGQTEAEVAKKLRERGKRLYKNYRWTNEMYAALFEFQNGKCAGCGRPPLNAPLNVDHKHFKIETKRLAGPVAGFPGAKWMAIVREYDMLAYGATKAIAVEQVRNAALPRSVRGLLCAGRQRGCNRLLGRIDNINLLEAFVEYLKNPPAREVMQKMLDTLPKQC